MTGSRIPRILLQTIALSVVVAVVMLSLFYAQYQWLARQIVAASYDEHRSLLEESYTRRARAELHAIADGLPLSDESADPIAISTSLNRAIAEQEALIGLRLVREDGAAWTSGNFPRDTEVTETVMLTDHLLLSYPVTRGNGEIGRLWGSFDLASLRADLARFEGELIAKEDQSRRLSYLWIGGGA